MTNNERNIDEYRDRNGTDRDWQRREHQQGQGMRDFDRDEESQRMVRGGQGSMYRNREQSSMYGGGEGGRYSERDYSGGVSEGRQFLGGRNSQFQSDDWGRSGGYGGGHYGGYGGGFAGERDDWNEQQFSGRTSRGYQDMGRNQMGDVVRQDMISGYGSPSSYGMGNRGGVGSNYGFSGREQGGRLYGGQSRSGEYGVGSWNDDMGQFGSDMMNRDVQSRRSRGSRGRDLSNERNFSGRGPQGYSRSPERIREEVCEFLTDDPSIDASGVTINVNDDGVVELSGEVDSRRTKRMIEDCCDHIRGVKDVRNNLSINEEFHARSRSGNGSNGSSNSSQSMSSSTSSKSKKS